MVEYVWYTLYEYPNLHCNDLCYLKTKQMWIYTVSFSTHFIFIYLFIYLLGICQTTKFKMIAKEDNKLINTN